jgi:sporulation protein YlmC with PRC-barrel domain
MSDFGRYGSSDYQDRGGWRDQEREGWRNDNRERGGIFGNDDDDRFGRSQRDRGVYSSDRADRGGLQRDRDFSNDREEGDFTRSPRGGGMFSGRGDDHIVDRDRPRDIRPRSNQPSRLSGGGFFDRDRDRDDRDDRSYGRSRERERGRNRFGNDDDRRSLPIDETEQLIASNKVEGTPVYGREGERLGTIYNFMVDKYSGRVTYAVMGYGGFLGVGQRYYPVPWQILTYDTQEGGYRVDLDARDMERAPSFSRSEEPRFNRDYGRRVHSWYGLDY